MCRIYADKLHHTWMSRADMRGAGKPWCPAPRAPWGHGEKHACGRSINLKLTAADAPERCVQLELVQEMTLQRLSRLSNDPPPQAKKGWRCQDLS